MELAVEVQAILNSKYRLPFAELQLWVSRRAKSETAIW